MLLLPVQQPDASRLASNKTRQVSRNFPPRDSYIGQWFAIQATALSEAHRLRGVPPGPQWAVVGMGQLTGAGYYPGFSLRPAEFMGRSYPREKGQAGSWIWTFSRVSAAIPFEIPRLASIEWSDGVMDRVDDGSGDWWGCCARELDGVTIAQVRKACGRTRDEGSSRRRLFRSS